MSNGSYSVREKVENYLTQRQEDKEFKDIGNRARGTAKEMKAYQMITSKDLLNIEEDDNVAYNLVKKDKVYPKINVEAEKEKGCAPSAVFMKMKLRELVQNNPPRYALARKIYVEYIELLIAATSPAKTTLEFNSAFYELQQKTAEWFYRTVIGYETYDYYQERIDKQKKNLAAAEETTSEVYIRWMKTPQVEGSNEKNLLWQSWQERKADVFSIEQNIKSYHQERTQALADCFPEHADTYSHNNDTDNAFAYLSDIIGQRFYNFYRNKDGLKDDLRLQAEKYDAVSKEQSDIELEALKNGIGDRIKTIREQLHDIDNIKSLSDEHKILSQFGTGWQRMYYFKEFPKRNKKFLNYKDLYEIRNSHAELFNTYAEIYKKLIRELLEKKVAELEKNYAKAIEENQPHEDDWSFAEAESKNDKKVKTVKEREPLAFIKRIGGLSTEDITSAKIAEHYLTEVLGFKAVTFGLTVTDKVASAHIRHFIGAMADLGEILNMDIRTLNELNQYNKNNKGLSFSLGAFISRFPASYHDDKVLINLTKSNGDGAVAHEYAHYLDNALAYIDNPAYMLTKNNAGMYGSISKINRKVYRVGRYENLCTIKNEVVCMKMMRIMNFIYYGNAEGRETGTRRVMHTLSVVDKDKQIAWRIPEVLSKPNIDEAIKFMQSKWTQYSKWENLTSKAKNIYSLVISHYGYKEYAIPFLSKFSNYYSTSREKGDYWSRDWELFARANEVYIYDKLDKAGRFNNYLVSFWEGDGLYPFGEEREGLFQLYDELYAAIKEEYSIPDFKPWTDKRTDDYIILDKKADDETEEAAVIVPATDDEKRAAALKKIQHFNSLLLLISDSQAKMKRGGQIRHAERSRSASQQLT